MNSAIYHLLSQRGHTKLLMRLSIDNKIQRVSREATKSLKQEELTRPHHYSADKLFRKGRGTSNRDIQKPDNKARSLVIRLGFQA